MHEELKDLGKVLRENRVKRNLTLKEIENATSIRISYLEAIEAGEMDKLISPIYAQGFIKKYATFLELDAETFQRENAALFKFFKDLPKSSVDFPLGVGTFEVRGTPGSEVKWLPNVLWVLLSAAVILIAWFTARYFHLF